MVGSLLLALGIVSCSAAGGHCDSPSTQLVRADDQQVKRQPGVTINDDLDEAQSQYPTGSHARPAP